MNNKKYVEPKRPPYTRQFTNLNELMIELRVHASAQDQVSFKWSETANAWEMTVVGLEL